MGNTKIGLDIDASALIEKFKITEKQLSYAVVNAVRRAALDVQKREQDNARAKLHLRGGAGEALIIRSVAKIFQFPSVKKGVVFAEIGIDQPKPRMLLFAAELGGIKTPFVGANVAVPITDTPARPNILSHIPDNLMIKNLGLQPTLSVAQKKQRQSIRGSNRSETAAMRKEFTKAAGAGMVWKGKERTYMIPNVGVFQRSGSGKSSSSQLIYKFVPKPQIKPTLGFKTLALSVGDDLLARYLDDEIKKSVIHNAGKS